MKSKANFTEVEKSQLMNLLPQKAEEAFNLIPSLRTKYFITYSELKKTNYNIT
jgi:hypothetical protein